ncbi:MAG: hypothetical protein HYY89_03360 [candidate division NC10 bacterium]|nr:hypothetical protein [candidate division NC10 bacterium]
MARTAEALERMLTEAAGLRLDPAERAGVVAAVSALGPALDRLAEQDLAGLERVTPFGRDGA